MEYGAECGAGLDLLDTGWEGRLGLELDGEAGMEQDYHWWIEESLRLLLVLRSLGVCVLCVCVRASSSVLCCSYQKSKQ